MAIVHIVCTLVQVFFRQAGGATSFPNTGVRVTVRRGDAAFWVNLRTSGLRVSQPLQYCLQLYSFFLFLLQRKYILNHLYCTCVYRYCRPFSHCAILDLLTPEMNILLRPQRCVAVVF